MLLANIFATMMLAVAVSPVTAQFDFGGSSCGGSAEFQQPIGKDALVYIGEILVGLEGLRIQLNSVQDIDKQTNKHSTPRQGYRRGRCLLAEWFDA
jgi:hypothetical protein